VEDILNKLEQKIIKVRGDRKWMKNTAK
jgi:hypothetical protein